MATIYINPQNPATGDGTEANPYQSWASVTWTAGNTYLQRAGTEFVGQVSVGGSGTSGSRIRIGRYGQGKNPIVGKGAQYGVYLAARQYIDIEDIDATGCTDHGFYIRTSGSNIQSITLSRCKAFNNQNNGFFLDGVVLSATLTNVTFTDCEAYDNLEHGFDTLGIITDVTWRRCKAYRNGTAVAGHGFSLHPFISNNITSGWTQHMATTVYYRTLSAGETVQKVANLTDGVTLTLNDNATTSVGSNEWDQNGTTLYINIGANPNSGKTMAWKRAAHGPFYYYDCEAWDNSTAGGAGEGHGFASDDMTGPTTYYRCYSHNNEGAGFQCQYTDDVIYYSCIATDNALSNFRTTAHTDTLEFYNCTSLRSAQHGFLFDDPFTGVVIKNCLSANNGTTGTFYGIIGGAAGATASNNCTYGNGSTGLLHTSNVTNSSGQTADPKIRDNFMPAAPELAAGGAALGGTDFYGRAFAAAPTIGAVQIVIPGGTMTDYESVGDKESFIRGRGRRR